LSELPINLPAGWDFQKVFGERPRTPAAPTERRADNESATVRLAALRRPPVAQTPAAIVLPKTATDADLWMIAGATLLVVSLILHAITRRRKFA